MRLHDTTYDPFSDLRDMETKRPAAGMLPDVKRLSGDVRIHVSSVDDDGRPTRVCLNFPGIRNGEAPDSPLTINGVEYSGFLWLVRADSYSDSSGSGRPYLQEEGPDGHMWGEEALALSRIDTWSHDDATDAARKTARKLGREAIDYVFGSRKGLSMCDARVKVDQAEETVRVHKETEKLRTAADALRSRASKVGAREVEKALRDVIAALKGF